MNEIGRRKMIDIRGSRTRPYPPFPLKHFYIVYVQKIEIEIKVKLK